MNNKKSLPGILQALGPGILFACVAVGGANFIQATHAGAEYGFKLIPLIVLIYILKYPFFEFANRYCAVTHLSLLDGYLKIGRWALWLYLTLTFFTAFPVIAALSLIDAHLIAYFLDTTASPLIFSVGLLSIFMLILLVGKFYWLDKTVKLVMALLIFCALVTFFIALPDGATVLKTPSPAINNLQGYSLIIALMGWIPAPIDVSVWITLWRKAKARETHSYPSLKNSLIDFNTGYFITALLTLIFLSLGAFVMFTSNQSFAKSSGLFITQLIMLFTSHIGKWGEIFIALTIFSVLLSATFTCLDAYPRAFTSALIRLKSSAKVEAELIYWLCVFVLFLMSIFLSSYFIKSMKQIIDIVTMLAFLTAPIFGYLNYRVATSSENMPDDAKPSKKLIFLSRIGLFFLSSACLLFLGLQFFHHVDCKCSIACTQITKYF